MDELNNNKNFNGKNVKIQYSINNITMTVIMQLNNDETLENNFNKYKYNYNLNIPKYELKVKIFHLLRGTEKILLKKNIKSKELNLKDGDLIIVSFQDKKNEIENISHIQNVSSANLNEEINQSSVSPKSSSKTICILIIIIIFLIALGLSSFLVYYFKFRKKNKGEYNYEEREKEQTDKNEDDEDKMDGDYNESKEKVYKMEELITKKRPYYPNNTLFLYKSDKIMEIELECDSNRTDEIQNMTKIEEYMDFGLIIRDEHQEVFEDISTIKKWYTGYIYLSSLTINNGTDNMVLNYNDEILKYINKINGYNRKNLRYLNETTNQIELNDGKELCFVKINFYENGETKDIFIPKNFNLDNMVYINKIIKLIIPKLSKNLYTENIDERIEQIDKSLEEINYEEEEEIENYLNDEIENIEEYYDQNEILVVEDINTLRRNSENDTTHFTETSYINNNNNTDELIYDDYGKELEIENSNSSNDDTPKYNLKGIYENNTYTKIIDFELENLESAQAKLDGSNLRRIKYSFIDEKGMLKYIIECENITIIQPDIESLKDLTEEENKLKTELYNENNEIPREEETDFFGNNITFNLSNIKSKNYNNISLITNIKNEELTKNIFIYFDSFDYTPYLQEDENELRFRVLKEFKEDLIRQNKNITPSEIEVEHTLLTKKKNIKRNLQTTNSYYGMKNYEKEKVLFKYNLIGLILEGIVVSKIDVSTGICDNYLKLTLGFINFKIKFNSMQTNLHLVIKNSHQMTFNFMGLLHYSNEDLIKRNKIYSDIIIDLEKNVSELFEESYDYSGLFRDSLEYLYQQVKNFSGNFFNELIELIERVYDNYTIILNQTENNEYDILNKIRNVTKSEYTNYINNMSDLIIEFKNDTLLFLINIKQEVDHIETFQLDVLYDIIDVIYDSKLVFKEFIKKLFKAVDRGITTFKYDLRDYMEEKIGELLYLTDFLSINLNKNEILKNAIDFEIRQNITIKLKNFRNIILRIEEILNDNIIKDYEEEMRSDNENSIKYEKEFIIQNCIEDIDNKTEILIEEIKEKIQYMNYYETYANNIQKINEITNKSFIEFNNDMYNHVLNNIKNISPKYLNKSSDFISNKNYLFSLSNDITNIINHEIKEINDYIESYSSNYINGNIYIYEYNLYNYRKNFQNDALSHLLNDFKEKIKEALRVHFIEIINNNYALAYQYMEEVQKKFSKADSYKLLGTVFINTYNEYKTIFLETAYLTSTDGFLDYVGNNFFNVSNFILNYVLNKTNSIKEYYFKEVNKDNFYKLDLIKDEIHKLTGNIKNYFNEINLDTDIKKTILDITLNEITEYNKEKEKKLDNLYNAIYKSAQEEKIHDYNCEIVQLIITRKRRWYGKKKTYYDYYCRVNAESRNNIKKITKDLSATKKYLSSRFNNLIIDFINKFDIYLNNYINYTQTLFDKLHSYTEGKIKNNGNIQLILNDYLNVFNNMLKNNTREKILQEINLGNEINGNLITNIITELGNKLFEINDDYYENHYLNDKQNFLEYPDEIILKLNQSINNLKNNSNSIKNKINLSFNTRIENIINSTILIIHGFNNFNLEYIIHKINKDYIFNKYILSKIDFLNRFFNSSLKYTNNKIENMNSNNGILNIENYDNLINSIEDNYYNFSLNLINEIDENFTIYNCIDYISTDLTDLTIPTDLNYSDLPIIRKCFKERYSTELNYSKYNFNVVKFRTEISNSRKFPEMFNQIFDGLNYNNIIDSNDISGIDDVINNKNLLYIYNRTKYKIKEIKNELFLFAQETFSDFCNKFIKNNPDLTNNYLPFLGLHKSILKYENIFYNKNISEKNNYTLANLYKLLNEFNFTLFNYTHEIMNNTSNYDYYSIKENNYLFVYNNYFSKINKAFNDYLSIIKNLKGDNFFYSIPKFILYEIFLERIRNFEFAIYNFSQNFDFDSIGFKYDLVKEFDHYIKNYFIEYEFNKTYDYFELMENNKYNYIDLLIKNISNNKNDIINKFNLIFDCFMKSIKNGPNFVKNDYIEKIKANKSRCLISLSDLYLNISYELNNTNITESDDFISNNCTIEGTVNALLNYSINDICWNLSGLNDSIYYKKYEILFNDCKEKNYYNFSYIILENFEENDIITMDEIISNITQTINENKIDDIYLYNYIKENLLQNISLDEDIDEYRTYFEDIEDWIFYIYNKKEPDYKNLMKDILIESFNKSYSTNVNLYLANEVINKINILVNDKLDIFIDYYSNKLNYDFEYYMFLLDQIEVLGNSSKQSIINLFSKVPKKLNESFYYIIEDEIFYYLDIFFRENKNIFIENFIKFYLNNEFHFNLSIWKIEDYTNEMIADRNFNNTLNNISSYLINVIKNKIKEKVKNSIINKMKIFIQNCGRMNNEIRIKLNKINTSILPEEMKNLVALINNYTILVENQNNRYNFIVGNNPFTILYIFIHQELEPPLSLILEKYNSIEQELLNKIKVLADDFPDCYSDIRKNLLATKINSTDYFTEQINSTIFEYRNILVNDIKSYLNKLIHFIYIDGLETVDTPCEESDCGIPLNNLRFLDEREITNIANIYKGHPLLPNKTKLKEKINKNIKFDSKRKTSSVLEYKSNMGALSEDNIVYYLSDLQETLLEFNKSYFGKEYLNINLTTIKFLSKINFTYLEKLRLSFDVKLVKFSTILTNNGIEQLKEIILKQFYLIEKYVHNSSNLVQFKIAYFLNEINRTTEFIESLSGYIHNKALGYYKMLYSTIQNKYEDLSNQKTRNLGIVGKSAYTKNNNITKITFFEIINTFDYEILHFSQGFVNFSYIFSKIFGSGGGFMDKVKNYTKIGKGISKPFYIPFPAFPYLQLTINISAYAGLGFFIGIKPNWTESTFDLVLDVYAEAKVPLRLEGGLYIPSGPSKFQIAFVVGLDGVIGHGRAGIKLSISLKNGETDCDLYFIFNALVFQFFFQIRIKIDFPLFKLEMGFDIIRIELCGFHYELHTLKKARQEAFKKDKTLGLDIFSPKPEGKDIILK